MPVDVFPGRPDQDAAVDRVAAKALRDQLLTLFGVTDRQPDRCPDRCRGLGDASGDAPGEASGEAVAVGVGVFWAIML